jgi:hypothetical protein
VVAGLAFAMYSARDGKQFALPLEYSYWRNCCLMHSIPVAVAEMISEGPFFCSTYAAIGVQFLVRVSQRRHDVAGRSPGNHSIAKAVIDPSRSKCEPVFL